jgi:hypothetical protein
MLRAQGELIHARKEKPDDVPRAKAYCDELMTAEKELINTVAKQELLEMAALILEQEGWLAGRFAHEINNGRLRRFSDRYQAWQAKLNQFREQAPDNNGWPVPEDNS